MLLSMVLFQIVLLMAASVDAELFELTAAASM